METTNTTTNTANWEKSPELAEKVRPRFTQRHFYMIAGVGLIGVIAFLIFISASRYYITVNELLADPELVDKSVQITGAVVDDYRFDPQTGVVEFDVINIPTDSDEIRDAGGLAQVLYDASNNPAIERPHWRDYQPLLTVRYSGDVPDLLKHEAQAIITGKLGEDGIFYADSLKLKCPTRQTDEGVVKD